MFLFDLALVVSRNATRGEKLTYQVSRPPLPLKSVSIETDEGGKLSGSFKGGILISDKTSKWSKPLITVVTLNFLCDCGVKFGLARKLRSLILIFCD